MACSVMRPSSRDEVHEREDEDPDEVDEVPEEPRDLDEVRAVLEVLPARHAERGDQQIADACEDVAAVEARDDVEGGGEVAGGQREPLVDEVPVLVALAPQEEDAASGGRDQPLHGPA